MCKRVRTIKGLRCAVSGHRDGNLIQCILGSKFGQSTEACQRATLVSFSLLLSLGDELMRMGSEPA